VARTCEQCGADAVDVSGVCRNCGWQASDTGFDEEDDAPSLGETRAADVPPTVADGRMPSRPAATPGRGGSDPEYGPPRPSTRAGAQPTLPAGQPVRYCGTCGARIGPGEAFCGQCGTPVGSSAGASAGDYGGGRELATSAASRYYVGDGDVWAPGQGDAPTEAYAPTPSMPYNLPLQATPYSRPGYGSGADMRGAQAAGPSRSARIVLGVLCLCGGIASAAGAIILMLKP
jgi:hypothetical protein